MPMANTTNDAPTPVKGRRSRAPRALVIAAASVLVFASLTGPQVARSQEFEELRQIELTEQHVKGFIDAQKDLQPLSSKLLEGGEKPDDSLIAQLETIAKKHGFKSFLEMEEVGANISIVLDGLDRKTGVYTDPIERMKVELQHIEADTSIGEEDKKLVIEDLKEEIAAAKPLKYPGNVDIVKKYQNELETLVADGTGESTPAEATTDGGGSEPQPEPAP